MASPAAEPAVTGRRSRWLVAKKLVSRTLRPYVRRRQIDALLLDGLRDASAAAAKAASVEPLQRQALEAVWSAVHTLESKLDRREIETDAIRQSSEINKLETRNLAQTVGTELTTFGHSVEAFQQAAAAHLNALEDKLQVQRTEAQAIAHIAQTDRLEARKLTDALADRLATFRASTDAFQQAAAAHLEALEKKVQQQQAATDDIRDAARNDRLKARQNGLQVQQTIQQTIDAFEGRLAAIRQLTDAFAQTASLHLDELGNRLARIDNEATTLANRLYAAPYISEPHRFHLMDDHGRRSLGYRSPSDAVRDGYRGFEDLFRGAESLIRDRQRVYVPLLLSSGPVVEIGSGRGEMLDLLRDAGATAIGTDTDVTMVERCRAKGHAIEHRDGLVYLKAQPDGSLGAVFAAQVVEHLAHNDFMSFLRLSQEKLKPGGRLIFETVNPHAIEAFKTFWTDLTHNRPIFPEVALAWCWLVGFERADVIFPNGGQDLEENRRTQGEYAVIATR